MLAKCLNLHSVPPRSILISYLAGPSSLIHISPPSILYILRVLSTLPPLPVNFCRTFCKLYHLSCLFLLYKYKLLDLLSSAAKIRKKSVSPYFKKDLIKQCSHITTLLLFLALAEGPGSVHPANTSAWIIIKSSTSSKAH